MNIYVIYKSGIVINAVTVPRVVIGAFNVGADKVQVWRNDKLIKEFSDAKEFAKFINPRPREDDETGGTEYEW